MRCVCKDRHQKLMKQGDSKIDSVKKSEMYQEKAPLSKAELRAPTEPYRKEAVKEGREGQNERKVNVIVNEKQTETEKWTSSFTDRRSLTIAEK